MTFNRAVRITWLEDEAPDAKGYGLQCEDLVGQLEVLRRVGNKALQKDAHVVPIKFGWDGAHDKKGGTLFAHMENLLCPG